MEPGSHNVDYSGVRDAYDAVARDYAQHLPDSRIESRLDLAIINEFADAVTAKSEGSRVLDAGCGTGRMCRYLTERRCNVEGVDVSPGMIAIAQHHHPDLRFAVGSLTELPYADDEFDGVLLWYSIIHTRPVNQERVFAEAARVLRTGGHLLIGFQCGVGVRDVAPTYRRFGHDIELVRYLYTADEIAKRVESVGLRETARLVRRADGTESDAQACVLAQKSSLISRTPRIIVENG